MLQIKQIGCCVLWVVGCVLVGGCRAATRVVDIPRVDLELSGGNRGYLRGSPPEAPDLKSTRQIVQTTIELPAGRRRPGSAPSETPVRDTTLGEEVDSPVPKPRHAHESTIFKK